MDLLSTSLLIVLVISLSSPSKAITRVSSINADDLPACYIHSSTSSYCDHPWYDNCVIGSTRYCCGPGYFCCPQYFGCCRHETWTGYEVAGVVLGSVAWLCIIVVFSIYIVPMLRRFIKRKRWFKKIQPVD